MAASGLVTQEAQIARVLATYPVQSAETPIGACVRNVLAKLATVPADAPLIERVDAIVLAKDERLYLRVDTALLSRLEGGSTGADPVFAREGRPRSAIHAELLAWLARLADPVRYRLVSFRERVTVDSLQCVVAVSSRPGFDYLDADIDLGGALTDVVGFVRHQDELVQGGLTDHLAIRERFLLDPQLGPLVRC